LAHQQGKEIILHMPMQSMLGEAPEEGVLDVDMEENVVIETLRKSIRQVPFAVGMNNHQGSLLTRHPGHMTWVMKEMKKQQLFFVDSCTSKQSVVEGIAREQGVPVLRRNVFLDHKVDLASIRIEFDRLIGLAKKNGHATGIGHPHPETLTVLREMLPQLSALNIEVVPVSGQFKKPLTVLSQGKKEGDINVGAVKQQSSFISWFFDKTR
jgi:hypothetical protein